jgi:excinuclease ABC subunit C
MLSYLVPGQLRPDARQRHLVAGIQRFEWEETPGELMALLLEDALIKEYQPRHNERQKDYRERRYLLLTADCFPACLVVEEPGGRAGTLFGPFKDEYFAAELRALLTDAFKLRACMDREPHRHSARYDLGQCLGPCRGLVDAGEYGMVVRRVREFLEGDAGWVCAELGAAMAEASDCLQFERAAALRDSIGFCERFAARQRFFHEFEGEAFVVDEPRAGLRYEFCRGALAAATLGTGEPVAIPNQLRTQESDRRLLLDRANVVYAWLRA